MTRILELGAGQGRDTIFFAKHGCEVHVSNSSIHGIETIREKAGALGLSSSLSAMCRDVREPSAFDNAYFDACYSDMLYCIALTTANLEFLSREIRRVLRLGGLSIFTVRNMEDPHHKIGIHRGEDMYESIWIYCPLFQLGKGGTAYEGV